MIKVFVNEPELDFSIEENKKAMEEALALVHTQFGKEYPLYIDGEKIFTEKKIKSINPCKKEEVVGYASSASREQADAAIRAAYKAYDTWRFVPQQVRCDYLQRLVGIMRKRRAEIAAWMIYESGKNFGEADGEVCEAIDFINSYCIEAQRLADEGVPLVESKTENNRCEYRPIGVGIIIPPWNFPFSIMVGMAMAAVVTGNTVVIKPASDTPVVANKFMEMCVEAGLPSGVVNLVTGSGGEIGDFLVEHPLTRFINFTGSMEVGIRINRLAANVNPGQIWLKRVVAEMGGKNAIIIDSSADLEHAANGVITSAYGYQGQKCSACSRAIVLENVYDEFVELIKKKAEDLKSKMGEGKDNAPFNAVISQHAFNNIVKYIEQGKKEGKLICGGGYDDSKGFYIEPTIIIDVDPKTAVIAKEEIFGPVLAVIKVKTFQEAIEVANGTPYGLTGAVYTNNRDNINMAKALFHVGNLYINRKSTGAVVGHHPFGGYNMSGTTAKTGTRDYLYNFLQLKSISENIAW
ncbi:MAG: L-glutamate gamma-semialdehyde dehydrogenase [Clostridiaceae bacterium]|nr:L-glutamate gamma-semialdehyde dehydrogenase [Clostridiaceae bacterium]